jgi:hypothetical protein
MSNNLINQYQTVIKVIGDRGSIPGRCERALFSPLRPYRLQGPPSVLYIGYRGLFSQDKAAGA